MRVVFGGPETRGKLSLGVLTLQADFTSLVLACERFPGRGGYQMLTCPHKLPKLRHIDSLVYKQR
jgi:hypothetical protein